MGTNFSCILTKDNYLLLKGNIEPIVKHETFKMITNTATLKQIEVGNNHLVALTSDSRVLCLGSNKFGQLGIGKMDSTSLKFYEADVPDYISRPTKIFAFKDASCFVSADGELFVWGGILDSRSQENSNASK